MLPLAGLTRLGRRAVRALWVTAGAGVAIFAIATAGGPGDAASTLYKALFAGLLVMPATLCLLRAALVAEQRWTWAMVGAGMLSWASAEILHLVVYAGQANPPYPSPVDVLWLGYYAFSLGALLVLVRTGIARSRTSLWIDALLGGLAVAAIGAAVLIEPILAGTGAGFAAVATTLAYPLIDVVIVGLLIGVFAISNGRPGRVWALLAVIWALHAVIDGVYLYQTVSGTYVFGTPLDAAWAALMLMIAVVAWHRPTFAMSVREARWGTLAVMIGFAVVGLTLTTIDHWRQLDDVAVVLATLALVAAFVRTTLTFAQMRTLAGAKELSLRNELILLAAGEGIVGTDAAGNITFINPAGARMTGHSPDELTGRPLHLSVHHTRLDGRPYPVSECPMHASLLDGTIHHCDHDVYWRKDGSSFPVEYTSTPMIDGGRIRGAVVVFRDIAERREIERAKDQFTSVVSHELRTPLTSIRGSLGLLESGVLGPLSDSAQRMTHIAVQNTDRLVRLINDILDLERSDSSATGLRASSCEAAELIARATEAMLPAAVAADVTLAVDASPDVFEADADGLIQTLQNLIGNAVKFSPAGGTVLIRSERRSHEILFSVRDHGRGIPASKLETIFGRFQQIDSSDSRQTGGTGLGLAICRSIVGQHGGRIWALSVPGEGSTFSFVVPASPAGDEDCAQPPAEDRCCVLLCNGDPETLEVTGSVLVEHGYRVVSALTGDQAMDLAIAERPDVIVLDLLLPAMNGGNAAASLQALAATRAIPVVVVSALSRPVGQARGPAAPWIHKSASPGQLLTALEDAMAPQHESFRVLCVEGDPAVGELLGALFGRHGVASFAAVDARSAVEVCNRHHPDLIVLDDDLAEVDGSVIKNWLRRHEQFRGLPIVPYDAHHIEQSEVDRRSVGAVAQILTKGQMTPEEFQWRVMTLLARPRAAAGVSGSRS